MIRSEDKGIRVDTLKCKVRYLRCGSLHLCAGRLLALKVDLLVNEAQKIHSMGPIDFQPIRRNLFISITFDMNFNIASEWIKSVPCQRM